MKYDWTSITKDQFDRIDKSQLIECNMKASKMKYWYDKFRPGSIADKTVIRMEEHNKKKQYFVRGFS
jgi:hypothetical protein